MSCLSSREISNKIVDIGEAKAKLRNLDLIVLGVLAGVYIGLAAHLATVILTGDCAYIGFKKFLAGAVFSVGLMLVVIPGAELFTGNNLMSAALLSKRIGWSGMLRNWVIVYFANFIGALALAFLIACGTGLLAGDFGGVALRIAHAKLTATPGGIDHWVAYFSRAILCNWLVCLAVMMAVAADSVSGKVWGIFFPIMAFVAAGFEHSVANMYFIPAAIFASTFDGAVVASGLSPAALESLTWAGMWSRNLIPVTLGNIVGGAIFTAAAYWYLHKPKA